MKQTIKQPMDTVVSSHPVDTTHVQSADSLVKQPLLLLRPSENESDSAKLDTLPLFYKEHFVSKDTTRLTEYHSSREFAPGFEGIPVPYSPRADDGIALTLLICFFLTSLALARGKKFLSEQAKDFVIHRERTSIFATSTASDVRYLLVLVLQTCVLTGIIFFNYFYEVNPSLMGKVPPHLLLATYMGVSLFYFLVKWFTYMFLGWVFFDKNKTTIWLESYSTLIYYLGFLLFPFVLFLIYFDLSLKYLTIIGISLIVITKILMFYKWLKLFFHQISTILLIILYFCALEIVPCLLLYRGLGEINNLLVLKI